VTLELPYSVACERNRQPILERLATLLARPARVLEIGAGTGQHAVFFTRALTQLDWQPTDRAECLSGLAARIAHEGPRTLRAPVELDVNWPQWPVDDVDAVYSANTLHIMSWPEVQAMMRGVGRACSAHALLILYGPFRYAGAYTSDSNASFDGALRARDPASGIRDFEAVDALVRREGFELLVDHRMPANNQLIAWRRDRQPDGDGIM